MMLRNIVHFGLALGEKIRNCLFPYLSVAKMWCMIIRKGCYWQQERGNMNKRILIALAAVMLVFGLAGCGENQIPDLTDEQMQMMGEFTAVTLMRYDANHRSRLVDYSLLMATPEPEITPEPEPTREPAGMDPVDDTPVINANGQTGANASLEETLEFSEGVTVAYTGLALYDVYPEGEGDIAIRATEGKKLLVLSFSVSNTTTQDQSLDLLKLEPIFRITVNGDYTRRALLTMLENDFATFKGTIPVGESTTTVLVIEIDSEMADNLTSISLNLKNDTKTCTIQFI